MIANNEMFLIDSGAQYPDGTTDVTRTVIVGKPTANMKDRFTRVLKGHIALATARFPEGTIGMQLDSFRAPAAVGSGAGLRSRHRPWRGLVPVGA